MENLPFGRPGRFFRGNLHGHSTFSDGRLSPEAFASGYREAGYDFIALSDHYLEAYGFPITDTRDLRTEDFTTLIAAELHVPETRLGEPWHILAVGLPLDFSPPKNEETAPEIAARAAAEGAFIGIVHPSWYGLTIEDAKTIRCAHGIEIYNHSSEVEVGRGTDLAFFDNLLNEGWRLSGFATDDSHVMTHDCYGGWVQVLASSLDPDEILQSLKQGLYYSSQGPEIYDVRVESNHVTIDCSPASSISAVGYGARSVSKIGTNLTSCRLPLTRFRDGYFRITIIDEHQRKAWTNPIW